MATYANPEDASNALHKLLLKAVPPNKHGNKTIAHLAELLGCSRQSIFLWINAEKIPANRAKEIVDINEKYIRSIRSMEGLEKLVVTLNDFHKFVYAT